ncbi:Crp/Fnr family transcriptional regulator [Marinimicrobium sp. ABcell2]|uniref:Crp/Fnr family transcriptional regulator n=1 Tax=Marinimicrobium sp. ABcell2 TaxID=3069751 RepID=UPI0027AF6914|nr:cyclic nucleotide-binding domain-containing protein [Marinimicrobium sp. ABcell2]MDQ2077683.1 cyclic nucleotide-binding domain-containing protein [Marinimicrobium sp. ABcell2]
MHLPHKQSNLLTDLGMQLRESTGRLLSRLTPVGEPITLSKSQDLLATQTTEQVYLITQGQAYFRQGGKLVLRLDTGDLIGLSQALGLSGGQYGTDESLVLTPYSLAHLLELAAQSPTQCQEWTRHLVCASCFYRAALAQEIRAEFQPSAGFMHFSAGETIIQQGTEADRVYTLLEGKAEALCDGVKVGDIRADEIFGALAVFTRQRRMASVVAASDCTVLAVRKEEFIDLVDLQPQICVGLIEEMAAKINQLNAQMLALQSKA